MHIGRRELNVDGTINPLPVPDSLQGEAGEYYRNVSASIAEHNRKALEIWNNLTDAERIIKFEEERAFSDIPSFLRKQPEYQTTEILMTIKDISKMGVAKFIIQLAIESRVTAIKTYSDAWANKVTELAGDVIQVSETEDLLIALCVAGRITDEDFIMLLFSYVNEPSNV